MTLAELVEEYGRASERVGELRAEILHRSRMFEVLSNPATAEDPAPPLAPLPREAPSRRSSVRSGTHRETFARVLADAGKPMAVTDLLAAARARGYQSTEQVAKQTLIRMVDSGHARRVSRGVYAGINGHPTQDEVTT